ncbi:MAG TPA: hypothetical protein DC054_04270 [Blastocatellia bacterium]|nr:hypothetical protein [Blastocatellia bacterium]
MSEFVTTKIHGQGPEGPAVSHEDCVRLLDRVQQEARTQQAHARAWELAKQQGVRPTGSIKELQGNFWPEEESADEFLAWLDNLRGNDKPRSIPE